MADQAQLLNDEDTLEPSITDADRPFTPADDTDNIDDEQDEADAVDNGSLGSEHPMTDSGIDPHETYDEGRYGAAGKDTPSAEDIVKSYTPPAPSDQVTNMADADHS